MWDPPSGEFDVEIRLKPDPTDRDTDSEQLSYF